MHTANEKTESPHGAAQAHHGTDGHGEPWRDLFGRLLKKEAGALWVVVLYAVFVGLLALATPVAVQALVNQVTFGQLRQPLLLLTVLLFLVLLFSGGLRLFQMAAVELLQQRLFVRLGVEWMQRLLRMVPDVWAKAPGTRWPSRFFEIVTVQKTLASLLLDGAGLVLQSAIGLFVLGFYHPLLLAFDVCLLVCIVGVMFGLGLGAVKTAVEESHAKHEFADFLLDVGAHSVTYRGGEGPQGVAHRASELLSHYVGARKQHFRVLRRQIVGALFLQAVAAAALLGLGGLLVIWGQLTLGQLVASELIVTAVVSGVLKFTKHMESLYDLLASVHKLGLLESQPLETSEGEALALPSEVSVRIHDAEVESREKRLSLHIPSIELSPGARAALVGEPSKALVLDLLYGFATAERGIVELSGLPLSHLALSSLRKQVVWLGDDQESIVSGTIEDNLRLGKQNATYLEMKEALSRAGLWEHIMTLPDGMNTGLECGGRHVGRSFRLKLAVARVLLSPKSLVLVSVDVGTHEAAELGPLFSKDVRCSVLLLLSEQSPLLSRCTEVFSVQNNVVEKLPCAPSQASDSLARFEGTQ